MNNTNKKSFSFVKAGMVLLGLTLAAKFLAFGRELAVATYFGSTSDTDSFFIANGIISNILYGLTTALAAAFLPVYIKYKLADEVYFGTCNSGNKGYFKTKPFTLIF